MKNKVIYFFNAIIWFINELINIIKKWYNGNKGDCEEC